VIGRVGNCKGSVGRVMKGRGVRKGNCDEREGKGVRSGIVSVKWKL